MGKRQFKAESKRLLEMMINSIYTHKEIFLRELISNASDAIDKMYFNSLSSGNALNRDDFAINIKLDKVARTITLSDNGIGMTKEELENNLGTIAKSGSGEFKSNSDNANDNIDIIGQFGVGFYSAFMVSKKIQVQSKSVDSDVAYVWESEGADGYTVKECDYDNFGSKITLYLKDDTENDKFGDYLEEYTIRNLVKKYSDYIRYPINTLVTKNKKSDDSTEEQPKYEQYTEMETLNSMVPIWHKSPSDISKEEYDNFYKDKFYDYTEPLKVVHFKAEGTVSFEALLYIPKKAPMNYYNKSFEKGLMLYSSGVMITECCDSLLPDYFSFVKGIVDCSDLKLNISRETLQYDHQLKVIAKNIEKKIKNELTKLMSNEREQYEQFFAEFGLQIKYGIYASYGMNKDVLADLLLFKSSFEDKYASLKDYKERMSEDNKNIYYACAESLDNAKMLPQTDAVIKKGYEVLYFTDEVDEFVTSMMHEYDGKNFVNVCADNADISTDEEKEQIKKINEENKSLLDKLKDLLKDNVSSVKFTNTLGSHPVCLSSEGGISTEMEKVLSKMPGADEMRPKAETVLEINSEHPISKKLIEMHQQNNDKLSDYIEILYAQARLISGLSVPNVAELTNKICSIMTE